MSQVSQPGPGSMPPILPYSAPQQPQLYLKNVATQQRVLNLCILGCICLMFMDVATRFSGPPLLYFAISMVYLAVNILAAICIFRLAMLVYNTGLGIVLGILTLVPILGLLILLAVNGKATRILRAAGIRVGLLGADPASIPADGSGNIS
jgi:hypothetical protein